MAKGLKGTGEHGQNHSQCFQSKHGCLRPRKKVRKVVRPKSAIAGRDRGLIGSHPRPEDLLEDGPHPQRLQAKKHKMSTVVNLEQVNVFYFLGNRVKCAVNVCGKLRGFYFAQ